LNRTVALVGQPNSGKSTLFNVLSDIKTSTSNFSGTSVKVSECKINVYGETVKLIDLPGFYSLNYTDQAEKVTFDYIAKNKVDLIVNVVDAGLIARGLELTQELIETGIPMILALNMMDDAKAKGLEIDVKKLSEKLNIPVVPMTAIFGKGVRNLIDEIYKQFKSNSYNPNIFRYTAHIENCIHQIENNINTNNQIFSKRFFAIKTIENPTLIKEIEENLDITRFSDIVKSIELEHKIESFEAISYERHHIAMKLAEEVSKFVKKSHGPFSTKIDSYLLDPVFGYVSLLLFFGLMFFVIFFVGSYITSFTDPIIGNIIEAYQPLREVNIILFLTFDGLFQGIAGALGIVMPYFIPLILVGSFLEETGYIARVAFMLDNLFNKFGLNGKSVSAFLMGIGCNIPAIYATRILDSQKDRLISAILIPFIPCSARITVIFSLTAAFAGPIWAVVVFLFILLTIAINGKILSKFLKNPLGMVIEIPDLRLPSFKVTLGKTYFKLKDFVREAVPFLILGSIALSYIEYYQIAKILDTLMYPVLHYALDLPEKLGSTLIFGFLRKELILIMASQALGVNSISELPMTLNQIIVFIIFVSLYFPCVTTFFVLMKEFGYKVAFGSAALSVVVATVAAFLFRLYFEITNFIF